MTVSASSHRLRLTLGWYVLILLAVAVSRRPCAEGTLGALGSIAGLLLMTAAALGRIWSSAFIAGHKDARLVVSGPYARCRNPLYAFSLVGGLGVGLASGSLILTFATVLVLWVLYWRAILSEEQVLRDRHGDAFVRYCAQVPRLIPAAGRMEPAERIEVNVAVYRKAFIDAASFMLIFALLKLLDTLRDAQLLPTLFELW